MYHQVRAKLNPPILYSQGSCQLYLYLFCNYHDAAHVISNQTYYLMV